MYRERERERELVVYQRLATFNWAKAHRPLALPVALVLVAIITYNPFSP